jgi:hypothetical protein
MRDSGAEEDGSALARPEDEPVHRRITNSGDPTVADSILDRLADNTASRCVLGFGLPQLRERLCKQFGIEAEWSRFGFEADDAFLIDRIKAIRPTGVLLLDLVLNSIDQRGEWDVQLTHARARHVEAFVKGGRVLIEDAVADVARHLPDIAGMRFGDVNHKERYSVFVLVVDFRERGNLPAKGRSGIASEDKHHRLPASEGRKRHGVLTVEYRKREIGRGITGVNTTGPGLSPHGFEGEKEEWSSSAQRLHHAREGFRLLIHRPEEKSGSDRVKGRDGEAEPQQQLSEQQNPHGAIDRLYRLLSNGDNTVFVLARVMGRSPIVSFAASIRIKPVAMCGVMENFG